MTVVYFDASRLFLRGGRSSPTGIDRVVFAYARWLRARPDVRLVPVWSRMGYLSALSRRRFDALTDMTSRRARRDDQPPGASWDALTAALRRPETIGSGTNGSETDGGALRAERDAKGRVAQIRGYAQAVLSALARPLEIRLERDALFFNVNHYGLEHPLLLKNIVRAGVRPVVMIHDLIPVNFPEFCSPGGALRHQRRLEGVLRHADRIITNSRATADELVRFARAHDLPAPNCLAAPLGLERAFLRDDLAALPAAPYFVCVGTIEPRKNLAFLLSVWRRLAERLGPATPPLVLIGRRGWENEAVIDQLERCPAILRHVHEVNNLGDHEVARLISGAAALLSPSFAEGFNLPVIEALSLATPVIASDIPVHRELAAGARLVDPLDGPGWLEAISAALDAAPASRASRRAFRPPTWEAHFDLVGSVTLDGLAPPPREAPTRCIRLRSGALGLKCE
jgi:glycosyltransferase involved in cell wall biosynthesis